MRYEKIFLGILILVGSWNSHAFSEVGLFDDKKFIDLALVKCVAEIETAKIALRKSTSPAVQSYAQLMINETRDCVANLRAVAIRTHIATDDGDLRAKAHKYIFARKNQSFDEAYANMRIVERRKMVNLYRSAIQSNNYLLKQYAEAELPGIMRHLYLSQQLIKDVGAENVRVAHL